jgi:AraC-like DNA-binding protein
MGEKTDSERINALIKERMLKRLPVQARISTPVEGLTLTRRDEVSPPETCFYQPMVALVVQGSKRAMIGNKEYRYGERQCMAVGLDMPGAYQITGASPQAPFLSLSIKLNRYVIAQLLAEMPPADRAGDKSAGAVAVSETPVEALDAFSRLLALLDAPAKIPALAPMILREIHCHLLADFHGNCLRLFGASGTQASRIAQAVAWLRENYAENLPVDGLARMVNMSPSTFHRRFRQATGLSPLQFQKLMRLYEAERLMLFEGRDAGAAALAVGYESGSQFNREYKRQFGEPPHRDVSKKLTQGVFPPAAP